jgi:hypothetical protein
MILVFCPNGHVFESRGIKLGGNVTGLILRGNRETCPACGAMAEIMDGEFDFVDGAVTVLSASKFTQDQLAKFGATLNELRKTRASPEVVANAIEAEAPELTTIASMLRGQNSVALAAWLAVLIALVQWLTARSDTKPLTSNDVARIVEKINDQQHSAPTTQPQPAPPQSPTTPPSDPLAAPDTQTNPPTPEP